MLEDKLHFDKGGLSNHKDLIKTIIKVYILLLDNMIRRKLNWSIAVEVMSHLLRILLSIDLMSIQISTTMYIVQLYS